jgi:hypothetical protein
VGGAIPTQKVTTTTDRLLEGSVTMDIEEATTISEIDEILNWLEMLDRQGLSMPLDKMKKLLDEAPEAAKTTKEYHYLRGLHDGRFLHEGLGPRTCL